MVERPTEDLNIHDFLDCNYGIDGDQVLNERLQNGQDPNEWLDGEAPIHFAAMRRRLKAVEILLDHGADIDAKNKHGKTAYVHAARRGFNEVAQLLAHRGADTSMNDADRLAVAISNLRLDEARQILAEHPQVVKTGNPDEDRLLPDVAGRFETEPVKLLVAAGADLLARGLDTGTALHVAAWFGQPDNARILIDAGAPLDDFEPTHESSPIGWAVHGSRYSGGADERQEYYVELVRMLLAAGSQLHYPGERTSDAYYQRLLNDATPEVKIVLEGAR